MTQSLSLSAEQLAAVRFEPAAGPDTDPLLPGVRVACFGTLDGQDGPLLFQAVVESVDDTYARCRAQADPFNYYEFGHTIHSRAGMSVATFAGTIDVPRDAIVSSLPPSDPEVLIEYLHLKHPALDTQTVQALTHLEETLYAEHGPFDRDPPGMEMARSLATRSKAPGQGSVYLDGIGRDWVFGDEDIAELFRPEDDATFRLERSASDSDGYSNVFVVACATFAARLEFTCGDYSDDDADAGVTVEIAFGDPAAREACITQWLASERKSVACAIYNLLSDFDDGERTDILAQVQALTDRHAANAAARAQPMTPVEGFSQEPDALPVVAEATSDA